MLLQKCKNFYNNILFNGVHVERHLGMELLTDVTPSIDTYYLFRRSICEYQERTGRPDADLLRAACWQSGTSSQDIRQVRPYGQ